MEAIENLKVDAVWTDDCSGKKSFDGDIITLSSRYWPGSYQQNGKPSAKASIVLYNNEQESTNHDLGRRTLTFAEFEGDTELEVKKQVEDWANAQFAKICSAIESIFSDGKA